MFVIGHQNSHCVVRTIYVLFPEPESRSIRISERTLCQQNKTFNLHPLELRPAIHQKDTRCEIKFAPPDARFLVNFSKIGHFLPEINAFASTIPMRYNRTLRE